MRTPVWITIVAVAGIVVAWLALTRSPEPKIVAAPETHAPATAPVARVESPAPATIPAPAPVPVEAKPPPAPVAPPSKAAEPAATEPPSDDAADAPADDESGDATDTADSDADAQSFDPHRAADLLADWMAKDDVATTGDDAAPPANTEALKTFDHEESDPHWSAQTAQQIQSGLDQWLDALPDDLRDHVDVIHVECRMSLCQILAAENDMDLQGQREQASGTWTSAVSGLSQQGWWIADGFKGQWTAMATDDSSGYRLYQTYLRRDAGPSQ